MFKPVIRGALAAAFCLAPLSGATAQEKTVEDGKYLDAEGVVTYNIQADGTVDWYTYSGFRRYHAECHVCHGPDGLGSTYAPSLVDSLKTMDYYAFLEVISSGRQVVNTAQESVMPAFGDNVNVACFLDDLYAYLKARSDGALDRGRPQKREDKPAAATEAENSCRGES